eukprot:gene2593-3346_t
MCETYCSKHGHFRGDPIDLQRKGFNAKEVERLLRIVDCFCDDGWEGRDCSKPVCATNKCVHGECIAPDVGACMFGYALRMTRWYAVGTGMMRQSGQQGGRGDSLDLDVQRQKAFQNKLGQLADTKAKLHDLQRQEKAHVEPRCRGLTRCDAGTESDTVSGASTMEAVMAGDDLDPSSSKRE